MESGNISISKLMNGDNKELIYIASCFQGTDDPGNFKGISIEEQEPDINISNKTAIVCAYNSLQSTALLTIQQDEKLYIDTKDRKDYSEFFEFQVEVWPRNSTTSPFIYDDIYITQWKIVLTFAFGMFCKSVVFLYFFFKTICECWKLCCAKK